MIRSCAIAKHCFDCSGRSYKEVILCHIFDCPLWEWRTGSAKSSKAYRKRMGRALKSYPGELKELQDMGISTDSFKLKGPGGL
jgi:hypothetical protein